MTDTQELIARVCDEIKELLLAKNKAYGDSALDPIRVFSSADPIEQLKVRIDDKISRISRGKDTAPVPEDTLRDLIGYLVLLVIAQEHRGTEEEPVYDRKTDAWAPPEPFKLVFFRDMSGTPSQQDLSEGVDLTNYLAGEGLHIPYLDN